MFVVTVEGFFLPLAARISSISLVASSNVVYRYRLRSSSFPLPPSGPYRLEGATLSDCLAANPVRKHP